MYRPKLIQSIEEIRSQKHKNYTHFIVVVEVSQEDNTPNFLSVTFRDLGSD